MKKHLYAIDKKSQLHIDKTSSLEKGIAVFPSIYIEAGASFGKTTAVKMLIGKQKDAQVTVYDLSEASESLMGELATATDAMNEKVHFFIFENVQELKDENVLAAIRNFIRKTAEWGKTKVILLSRECPPKEWIDLIWKGQMEIISARDLLFTKREMQEYADAVMPEMDADALYHLTGGHPGCSMLLLRMKGKEQSINDLFASYEVRTYLQYEMFGALSEKERQAAELCALIPWINEELLTVCCGGHSWKDTFERLERKGILIYHKDRQRYTILPVFRTDVWKEEENLVRCAAWYEKNEYLLEAGHLLKNHSSPDLYRKFLYRHYDKAAYFEYRIEDVEPCGEYPAESCFLCGILAGRNHDFSEFSNQVERLSRLKTSSFEEERKKNEIYLNLQYMNPKVSLEEWMVLLEQTASAHKKMHLYYMLGNGFSYLCGIRDLTGLFSCSKKDENYYGKLWKDSFGKKEWLAYRLARYDYYLETKREDSIKDEDRMALDSIIRLDRAEIEVAEAEMWRLRLAGFYLLCRRLDYENSTVLEEPMRILEAALFREDEERCDKNTEAVSCIFSAWKQEPERFARWIRSMENQSVLEINQKNFGQMYCLAKGYLYYNHFDKAERIINKLLPFFRQTRRNRYYAEILFQCAIIHWEQGKKGLAIRNVMESFLVAQNARYVNFYTNYGKIGYDVLEAYAEWMRQNTPEGWHRKKKYNYGNVLRMPMAEYIDVVLRGAKKETRLQSGAKERSAKEHLTMMETIILQDISRGLTNAQICEEQNLKLPTVKTHIYSLYKKLGVKSRVQAVNKGKEMGIVK